MGEQTVVSYTFPAFSGDNTMWFKKNGPGSTAFFLFGNGPQTVCVYHLQQSRPIKHFGPFLIQVETC